MPRHPAQRTRDPRAQTRHAVWRAVYHAARQGAPPVPDDPRLAQLAETTWRLALAYLAARADGYVPSPPGGVGMTRAARGQPLSATEPTKRQQTRRGPRARALPADDGPTPPGPEGRARRYPLPRQCTDCGVPRPGVRECGGRWVCHECEP